MTIKTAGMKLLKASVTTLTGSLLLMLMAGIAVNAVGTSASGGVEQWKSLLKSIAPYLLLWRLLLYVGIGFFCYRVYLLYWNKGDNEGANRLKRIGRVGAVIIVLIEASRLVTAL